MARFTGLAERGPAAGVTTVFPDGWREAWHPARPPDGEPHLDDLAPPQAVLIDHEVVRHPPAERLRIVHLRPAGGQAVQRFLVNVLAQALV